QINTLNDLLTCFPVTYTYSTKLLCKLYTPPHPHCDHPTTHHIPLTNNPLIHSGKIVPRYDTLLELVRILDRDLIMVPRALVPAVQSLIRDHLRHDQQGESDERPLYGDADDEQKTPERKDEV